MKCPLTFSKSISGYLETKFDVGECLQEECAWWEKNVNMCSIIDIALELRYTQMRLADLDDRLRRGGRK